MKRASGSTASRSPGRQKKRQSSSKPSGAPSSWAVTFGRPPSGRKLVKAPSARSTARSSILPRSAASTIGTRCAGAVSSLKPLGGALAVERRAQEVERLATLLSGRSKGIPFQPSTIRSEEEPIPSTKRPREALGQRRRLLRQQRRPALEDADDPGSQPRPLRPGRAQRQRREPIGPVRLAAPEVGVPSRLRPLHMLLVIGQRESRQRQCQSPALHQPRPYP